MEFIEVGKDKYLVKDSNGLIVSSKDIKEYDKKSNPEEKKVCKQCMAVVEKKGELIDKSVKPENIK